MSDQNFLVATDVMLNGIYKLHSFALVYAIESIAYVRR
jgi:hypothetical protein